MGSITENEDRRQAPSSADLLGTRQWHSGDSSGLANNGSEADRVSCN